MLPGVDPRRLDVRLLTPLELAGTHLNSPSPPPP